MKIEVLRRLYPKVASLYNPGWMFGKNRVHLFDGEVDCDRTFSSTGTVKPAIQLRADIGSSSDQERSVIATASSRFAGSPIKSIVPAARFGAQ